MTTESLGHDIGRIEPDDEFIRIMRGWEEMVDEPGAVIDCDVVARDETTEPIKFQTLAGVRGALVANLARHQESTATPKVITDKVEAAITYIDAISGGGDKAQYGDYPNYVEKLMGMRPIVFSEAELARDAHVVDARLQKLGLQWLPEYRDAFQERFVLKQDGEAREQLFKQAASWAADKIITLVGGSLEVVEPVLADEDEVAYMAATYTDEAGDFVFEVNMNPINNWTSGEVSEAMTHEPAHGVQINKWRDAIAAGTLRKPNGITTLFTPEMTQLETVAVTTSSLILEAEVDNPELAFQAAYSRLQFKVMNNAHIMIHSGQSLEDCVAYVLDRLPFEISSDAVKEGLVSRRDTPNRAAYDLTYGFAARLSEPVLSMPPQKQQAVLQKLYDVPMTAQTVKSVIAAAA